MGGSQAINYVVGMVRTKLVALLLGPSGVGMIGLFQSSIAWVMQLTGLGIGSSGVRQIAKAHSAQDTEQVGKTIRVLRRACWFTGILGWVVAAILSRPLSIWVFESTDNAWLIAILGATLLLTGVSSGQKAIIQGTRRISDLAKMTVLSSLLSTIFAIFLYWLFGVNAIVPVLVSIALLNLAVSWWFSRKLVVPDAGSLSWTETYQEGKQLTNLGVAFMWGGLLASLVDMGVRALIVREVGIDGTGYYQAAWALSGMFANFILGAMGADFYPRLTGVADNHPLIKSMVNEQIEVGVLIAVPGLVATLAVGPLLLVAFYSTEFIAAAEVLPWFVFAIFFRVMSWPVGYTVLAKGATGWFFVTQTFFFGLQMFLAWMLISPFGLVGAGISFLGTCIPAVILNLFVANRLTGFVWSRTVLNLFLAGFAVVCVAFLGAVFLSATQSAMLSLPLAAIASVFCIRGISARVGKEHRIVRTLLKIPGMKLLMPN